MNIYVRGKVIAFGFIYSSLIALLTFAFLQFEHVLIEYIWFEILFPFKEVHPNGAAFILAVYLLALTWALYLMHKKFGILPEFTADVKKTIREHELAPQHFPYHIVPNFIATILILISGAGVGPEAPLLAMIYASSIFQADKLRYFELHMDTFDAAGFKMKLKMLFSRNEYVLNPDSEGLKEQDDKGSLWKSGLMRRRYIALYVANGLVMFFFLKTQVPMQAMFVKLDEVSIDYLNALSLVLLSCIVYLVGKLYVSATHIVPSWCERIPNFVRLLIGPCTILCMMFINEDLLFSGQFSIASLIAGDTSQGVLVYALYALEKLALLYLCTISLWRGGDIFPLLYAGFALSIACAILLHTEVLVVAAFLIPAWLMASTHLGIAACIFAALFIPLQALPLFVLASAVSLGLKRCLDKLQKKYQTHSN